VSKSRSQAKHARRRALQRHGIHAGRGMTDRIAAAILHRSDPSRHLEAPWARLVESQSNRVRVYDVQLTPGDTVRRVVWDKHRRTVVTFLWSDAESTS